MENDSVYIYGIVEGKINKTFSARGMGSGKGEIVCVPYKDVTAIVTETPFVEYDPTEENTLAHESVIQELIKDSLTIAPMRFCTILRKKSDVMKLMHSAYLPFKKNILKIRNRLEFSVKVFLDVEKLRGEIGEEGMVEKSREIATGLYEELKQKTDDSVLEEQIIENIIMNATFLVHRDNVRGFYGDIQEFDKRYPGILKIRISGPTAPYNFVDMPSKP